MQRDAERCREMQRERTAVLFRLELLLTNTETEREGGRGRERERERAPQKDCKKPETPLHLKP